MAATRHPECSDDGFTRTDEAAKGAHRALPEELTWTRPSARRH